MLLKREMEVKGVERRKKGEVKAMKVKVKEKREREDDEKKKRQKEERTLWPRVVIKER